MKQTILAPVITEKSMGQVTNNQYRFYVHTTANKVQVSEAVTETYKVKVKSVNIVNRSGKTKNYRGRVAGRTKDRKIAVVTLESGQKINDFNIKQ